MPTRPISIEQYLKKELNAFENHLNRAGYSADYSNHLLQGARLFIEHLFGRAITRS